MRFRFGLAAITLAALTGAQAQAADQKKFDLVCTGTASHVDAGATASYLIDTAPITMRLSIDLKAKRWCYRDTDCSMTFPVASVENDTLHLLAVRTDLNEASFDIVRSTGAYSRRFFTPQYSVPMLSTGVCVAAPFTPIK